MSLHEDFPRSTPVVLQGSGQDLAQRREMVFAGPGSESEESTLEMPWAYSGQCGNGVPVPRQSWLLVWDWYRWSQWAPSVSLRECQGSRVPMYTLVTLNNLKPKHWDGNLFCTHLGLILKIIKRSIKSLHLNLNVAVKSETKGCVFSSRTIPSCATPSHRSQGARQAGRFAPSTGCSSNPAL